MKTPAWLTNPDYYVAHTPGKDRPDWHPLPEHALMVAKRAKEFAEPLGYGAGDIAYFLGLLHDLGKFTPAFQQYLRDCAAGIKRVKGSAPHKQHGALAATLLDKQCGNLWRLALQGHHGGMKSPVMTENDIRGTFDAHNVTDPKQYVRDLLDLAAQTDSELAVSTPDTSRLMASPIVRDAASMELFVRLLFSCLVDADARDTEAHGSPAQAAIRETQPAELVALRDKLVARQEAEFSGASGMVNAVRCEVYDACCRTGHELPPGFFTLTVPTGGGKTRSSLAFALEHAVAHGKRRVVYAIPYTSIIDQTADVFRQLFGDDPGTVLEHHSAIEPRKEKEAQARRAKNNPLSAAEQGDAEERADDADAWRVLAAQDWNAPLIVTTTVQLFESLFARKPAPCRKLHRLAHSVIVLDEVQCLPAHLLAPIRLVLKTLVEQFGATVVFCTATQPAHEIESQWLAGVTPTPILPPDKVTAHFDALKRVTWTVKNEPWGWERVATEVLTQPETSTLCVVNTRKQAQDLMGALKEQGVPSKDVLHLSTLLCPAHRRDVIAEVKRRLQGKERLFLVSTQVIEAGVDLSFPRLFRALGPLERMVQAAGRCNRENELFPEKGEVVVFLPEDGAMPRGWYDRCCQQTKNMIARGLTEFDDPEVVTAYFAELYTLLESQSDEPKINDARCKMHYEEVAEKFRMIDNDTESIFVTAYRPDEANAILSEIERRGEMTQELWRKAGAYSVSLYRYLVNDSNAPEVIPGFRVWQGEYDEYTGIPMEQSAENKGLTADDLVL